MGIPRRAAAIYNSNGPEAERRAASSPRDLPLMASLLEMPSTVDEAFARMGVPLPEDVQLHRDFRADAYHNYRTGGSFGRACSWALYNHFEEMEPEELQIEKERSWHNLHYHMCNLCLLDHMDDRLELVRVLRIMPAIKEYHRELYKKRIADARTEFLLLVMASIANSP
jgi:hypothetical protein